MDKDKATKSNEIIYKTFRLSIFLKGINGLLEIISGALLFIFNPVKISKIIFLLTQNELIEDPKDAIANYLINLAHNFSVSAQIFGVFFLVSHGIIKIFLVISLWKKRLWAYPMASIVFLVFIFYQIYRYNYSHSVGLIFLTILDIIVIILTGLEYRQLKK